MNADTLNAAQEAIATAARHAHKGMPGSAALCLQDARLVLARGDHASAIQRARDSLLYSVGVFHVDAQHVASLAQVRA